MFNQARDRLIDYIQNHPKRCLLFSLIGFLLLAPGLALLTEDYSYRVWYDDSDPLLKTYDEYERKFGNDDSVFLAIHNPKGLYNPESLKKIYHLTEDLWKVDYIMRVDSLTNFDQVTAIGDDIDVRPMVDEDDLENLNQDFIDKLRKNIESNKLTDNFFIGRDGTTAVIRAHVQPSFKVMPDNEVITTQARALAKKYADENHKIHVAGTAVLTHMYKEITNEDVSRLVPLLYLIFTVLLYLIYRRKSGVLLPYLIITISIGMMMGTLGYIGEPLNAISSIAPNILLTVAIADAVHILTVYYFGIKRGFNNHQAVNYTLTKNFYPTLLTSITTSVGFFSFLPAKIHAIAVMGLAVGIGVIYAWLLTYFMLGPILQLLPYVKKEVGHEDTVEHEAEHIEVSDTIKRRIENLYKVRWPVIGATFVVALVCLYLFQFLVVNMDPFTQFKKDHPLIVANDIITDHIGPTPVMEIMINSGKEDGAKEPAFLKKVDELQQWLQTQDYIVKTMSINDIIRELNQKLHNNDPQYYVIPDSKEAIGQELFFYTLGLPPGRELNNRITLKNDSIRLTATWNIHNSNEANKKIAEIYAKFKEMGLDAQITGKMPLFHDLTPYVVSTFVKSFRIALIAITIILILVLGSIKLGILALIPNLFPLLVGSAIYSVMQADVDIASVLIASVSLGIAVDDSIHFLFEYQKYRKLGHDINETFGIIMTNTFPSLFNTTLLIVIGFGSFVLANYIPNAKFGAMVAIILVIALFADFVILPAILMVTDKGKKHA
jgi:predicted RND superfamily exporter protein